MNLNSEHTLKCPICGYDYVHIENVDHVQTKRGDKAVITFWGECDHRWTSSWEFYKGQVFVEETCAGCSKSLRRD